MLAHRSGALGRRVFLLDQDDFDWGGSALSFCAAFRFVASSLARISLSPQRFLSSFPVVSCVAVSPHPITPVSMSSVTNRFS